MRRNGTRLVVAVACFATMAACSAGPGGGYKQPTGTLLGAAAGGLLGAQLGGGAGTLATVAAGTLLGAALGSETGASLDRADAAYARSPGYYVPPPPAAYAPTYATPGYGTSGYGASGQSRLSYGLSRLPAGCQAVGSGIWCEQANGTFSRGY